jgi:hypothetical protein
MISVSAEIRPVGIRLRLPIDFNYFRNGLIAGFLQAENKLLEVMEEWKNKLPPALFL